MMSAFWFILGFISGILFVAALISIWLWLAVKYGPVA